MKKILNKTGKILNIYSELGFDRIVVDNLGIFDADMCKGFTPETGIEVRYIKDKDAKIGQYYYILEKV